MSASGALHRKTLAIKARKSLKQSTASFDRLVHGSAVIVSTAKYRKNR